MLNCPGELSSDWRENHAGLAPESLRNFRVGRDVGTVYYTLCTVTRGRNESGAQVPGHLGFMVL